MRSPWCWCGLSLALALLGTAEARAATVLEQVVQVEIQPDGRVRERTRMRVRMDTDADRQEWGSYALALDEHRRLESLSAEVEHPDGRRRRLRGRDLDTVAPGDGETLHSSTRFRYVRLAGLVVGSVVSLEHEVVEEPYFPAGALALGSSDTVDYLDVHVRGGGPGWRWRLDGHLNADVREEPGGIRLVARGLQPRRPPEHAPTGAKWQPILRYAWGPGRDWPSVAAWFEGLLAQVPRAGASVRARAAEAVKGAGSDTERLGRLLKIAREDVRYVAVEVGIGGYRPFPPDEVIGRAWGDCKDKGLLLVELMRAQGMEAYPALVRASVGTRIDVEFPAPGQFNHAVVAVPAAGLDLPDGAPVADGFLFLDATLTGGSLTWLPPALQDQHALVVAGARSRLVHLPARPDQDEEVLTVEVAVGPDGAGAGTAVLELTGAAASGWREGIRSARAEEVGRRARHEFSGRLPGARLQSLRWGAGEGDIPRVRLETHLEVAGLMGGRARVGLALPAATSLPAPSVLEERDEPVVLTARRSVVSWRLALPLGSCAARPSRQEVRNGVGWFRQDVRQDGDGALVVDRETTIRRPWVAPDALGELREIALAEHQAARRRLRLDCPEQPPPAP